MILILLRAFAPGGDIEYKPAQLHLHPYCLYFLYLKTAAKYLLLLLREYPKILATIDNQKKYSSIQIQRDIVLFLKNNGKSYPQFYNFHKPEDHLTIYKMLWVICRKATRFQIQGQPMHCRPVLPDTMQG